MKTEAFKKNLISDIYGSEKYSRLIAHLKENINKSKTVQVKQDLGSYSFDDLIMYPEIAGKNLKSVSIRLKSTAALNQTTNNGLSENARSLINEAENYRQYLDDPDLLKQINFRRTNIEYKPVCGIKVDCYDGVINQRPAKIKVSQAGLEIIEKLKNLQKFTFLDWATTQIMFIKEDKFGIETIIRKVSKFMDADIVDKIKVSRKI